MRVVGGCDGGGTKCTVRVVALSNDGSFIRDGQASAGSANVKTNPDLALENILAATRNALKAAGMAPEVTFDGYVAALAGAGAFLIQRAWEVKLSEKLSSRKTTVIPDVFALFSAVDLPPENIVVATIVGTGAIALSRHPLGQTVRSGGLGPDVGDQGSGYWIGKQAVQRCILRGELGLLRERILARFGDTSLQLSYSDTASLARDVFDLAEADPVAQAIVVEAATHITQLLRSVAGSDSLIPTDEVSWVCAGGVAVHQREWLESIRERCNQAGISLNEPHLVREPVHGAMRLAIDQVTQESL